MKEFLNKPRKLWIHIVTYVVLAFVILAGSFLMIRSYEKYQPIVMEPTRTLTTQGLIDEIPMDATKASINQYLTEEELSRLFFNELHDYNPPIGKDLTLEAYYYNIEEEISYFNFTDDGGKLYSFVAHTKLENENGKVLLSFSDFKLGKYKIGLLGKYYSKRLDITDSLELDFNNLGKMVYINNINIDDPNKIICNYTYNIPLIKEEFKSYKEQLDHNKVDIYVKADPKIKEFTEMLANLEGYSDEGIGTWMSQLQSDRQLLESCALILKDDGVKKMCEDFQVLYNNTLQPERLIEVSQNELNYALMQYHRDFSRALLNYFYRYKEYDYSNGQLVVNGALVSAEMVLSEKGKEALYDVELISDLDGISASYHTGDQRVQKLILRKE